MHFTVVTPSFNQLNWLRLAVASVADQVPGGTGAGAEFGIEHIVQDGGSEGFTAFADEMEQRFPARPGYTLRLVSEPDSGMYDAINRGLQKAGGEVCAWLNCDEQYLPGAIETAGNYLRDHPFVDVVFGDSILVDDSGVPLSYRRTVRPDPVHIRLHHLNTPSCATFFRKSTVVNRGHLLASEWKTIGDAVWMERLLRAGCRTACLGVPVAAFTLTGENLGASGRALEEMAAWRSAADAPPRWLGAVARARHLLRKVISGAYKNRKVSAAIYTKTSPMRRVGGVAREVGWRWVDEPVNR